MTQNYLVKYCANNHVFRKAEFDKPIELLKNEKGFLRRLVDESGDKEKLIAMASGADRSSSA